MRAVVQNDAEGGLAGAGRDVAHAALRAGARVAAEHWINSASGDRYDRSPRVATGGLQASRGMGDSALAQPDGGTSEISTPICSRTILCLRRIGTIFMSI